MSNFRRSKPYLLKAAYSEYSSIEFWVRWELSLSPTAGGLIEVLLFSQWKYHNFLNCWIWWSNLGRKYEYELLASKRNSLTFFFLSVILDWANIDSAWSWTYWLASHRCILDCHHNVLLRTQCCYTLRFSTSQRIFLFQVCLVLLYSNAMFQLTSR